MREKVEKALESIRPSLQADGGDIQLVSIEDGLVKEYMKAILLQKGFKVVDGGYESSGSKKRRENNYYQAYSILDSKKVFL